MGALRHAAFPSLMCVGRGSYTRVIQLTVACADLNRDAMKCLYLSLVDGLPFDECKLLRLLE